MKACFIIHNMVVEARRDYYPCGTAALDQFSDVCILFQVTYLFTCNSRAAMKYATDPPLTDSACTARAMDREEHIRSSLDHFELKRNLIAQIWKEHSF